MAGLINTGLTGLLTIDSILLHGPAWDLPDLRPIWMSAAIRGQDRTLPLTEGQSPRRRRRTGTRHLLPMYISGEVDPDGDPVPCDDEEAFMANLRVNIDYLLANVVKQPVTDDGTRAASLLVPGDATPRTTDLHVLNLVPGELRDDGLAMKAILEISIPNPSDLIAS